MQGDARHLHHQAGFTTKPAIWCVTPNGGAGGIWMAGSAPAIAGNDIYFTTGNALFDANTANGHEWGDSVLALHADGTGSGMGWPVSFADVSILAPSASDLPVIIAVATESPSPQR